MIIQNKYVKVRTNKEYVLHNYIYDEYLEAFSKSQYFTENNRFDRTLDTILTVEQENERSLYEYNKKKFLGSCYIKFDTQLEDYKNSIVEDFDIQLHCSINDLEGNKNGITITYTYDIKSGIYSFDNQKIESLSEYFGRKITAIGFKNTNDKEMSNNKLMACIDTSGYSMLLEKTETFCVIRRDIISSNAECTGYDYPVHLTPRQEINSAEKPLAKLVSVGVGANKGIIENEYVVGKDVAIEMEKDNIFKFNLRAGLEQSIFAGIKTFASSKKYPLPARYIKELYLNSDVYASSNKYPLKANSRYVILKYRLYYMSEDKQIVYLDKYYTMNFFSNVKGIFKVKNTIERRK